MTAPTQFRIGSATIGTTEYSLAGFFNYAVGSCQTTPGAYSLLLDATNVTNAEVYTLKMYDKVLSSSGTQVELETLPITLPQRYFFPFFPLRYGWDMTLKKVSGTDRVFTWRIETY